MKKLFYRLKSSWAFTKLFSMQARLEERRRVMFPKSSVFAVVALAAFVSLGVFVFPHVGHAQECVWDCDLGSDPSFNPWGNSPQSPDIAYCIDRGCVLNLKDSSGNPIFTGNNIPTPQVKQVPSSQNCSDATRTVTINGNIVALLRDQKGNLDPTSAAQALLNIVINGVTCTGTSGETILSRVVAAGQTNVFGPSSITIQPPLPRAWRQSCGNLNQACVFPVGLEVFNNASDVAKHLPAAGPFSTGEAYRAEESTRFIGVRDCKGNANGLPSTIACSNGEILTGGDAQALFKFTGNWSGAEGHTINPNSGNNPFDMLLTPLDFNGIRFLPNTVFASANNGPEVPTNGCNDQVNQNTERCFFTASALLPNGCNGKTAVAVQVTGKLIRLSDNAEFNFVSRDNPVCSK